MKIPNMFLLQPPPSFLPTTTAHQPPWKAPPQEKDLIDDLKKPGPEAVSIEIFQGGKMHKFSPEKKKKSQTSRTSLNKRGFENHSSTIFVEVWGGKRYPVSLVRLDFFLRNSQGL